MASKDGLWGIPETARGHGNRKKKIYIYISTQLITLLVLFSNWLPGHFSMLVFVRTTDFV